MSPWRRKDKKPEAKAPEGRAQDKDETRGKTGSLQDRMAALI